MPSYKLLLVPDNAERDAPWPVRQWAEGLAQLQAGVTRIEFDPIDREAQAVHDRYVPSTWPSPGMSAIVSLWAAAPPGAPPAAHRMLVIEVADRVGYGFEGDGPGPVRGYKKFSMWGATPDVPRETWDPLYAHHIVTVPQQQPIWRYRQNIIVGKPQELPYDAISENWWATVEDLSGRFYFSEASRREVQAETVQFVDYKVHTAFIARNEVLFIA